MTEFRKDKRSSLGSFHNDLSLDSVNNKPPSEALSANNNLELAIAHFQLISALEMADLNPQQAVFDWVEEGIKLIRKAQLLNAAPKADVDLDALERALQLFWWEKNDDAHYVISQAARAYLNQHTGDASE